MELVQQGRLILGVSATDLEAAESTFGAFHPTGGDFRNSLARAQRSWEQLRVELGAKIIETALPQPADTNRRDDKGTLITVQVPGRIIHPWL